MNIKAGRLRLDWCNKLYTILLFSVSTCYIVLCQHIPISIPTDAPHDHEMFFKGALSLINGEWLGAYDQLTLTKGPFYKIFIAINYLFGLPITLTYSLLFLASCILFLYTCLCLGLSRITAIIIYVIILFQPVLIQKELLRDDICPTLLLTSYSLLLLTTISQQKNKIYFPALSGLSFSLLYLTREDSIWVIPGVCYIIITAYIIPRVQNSDNKLVIRNLLIITIFSIIPILLICLINGLYYGKSKTTELSGGPFAKTIQLLTSVKCEEEIPYLPVPKSKREQVYKVSPSFNKLKKYFEEEGKAWSSHGAKFYPWTENDYAAGWFCWALRDAVASVGYYDSPNHADQFYNQIIYEVQDAADNGKIKLSHKSLIPLMPNINKNQLLKIFPTLLESIKYVSMKKLSSLPFIYIPSGNCLNKLELYSTLLCHPPSTPSPSNVITIVNGWYFPKQRQWIELSGKSIKGCELKMIPKLPSKDVSQHFSNPELDNNRFNIIFDESMSFKIFSTVSRSIIDTKDLVNDFNSGKRDFYFQDGSMLHIDYINTMNQNMLYKKWVALLDYLSILYHYTIPFICIVGCISYMIVIIGFISLKTLINPIFVVSTSSWVFLFSRLFLLSVVHVSSFPGLLTCYLLPGYLIIIIASLYSIILLKNILQNK